MPTQIPVAPSPANTLHLARLLLACIQRNLQGTSIGELLESCLLKEVDVLPVMPNHAAYAALLLGHLHSAYIGKQINFLLCYQRNLCGISFRLSASCLLLETDVPPVMPCTQPMRHFKGIFRLISNTRSPQTRCGSTCEVPIYESKNCLTN